MLTLALSIPLGFTVAAATAIFLGRERAMMLPAGSMVAGMAAVLSTNNFWLIAAGTALGIVGWVIYREIAKRW